MKDMTKESYSIFQTGGKQYQAIVGKTVAIEKLDNPVGDQVTFNEVLIRKTVDEVGKPTIQVGTPFVEAPVKASVLRHDRAAKIIVFKFKRRKKHKRKQGHRQPFTVVRIEAI